MNELNTVHKGIKHKDRYDKFKRVVWFIHHAKWWLVQLTTIVSVGITCCAWNQLPHSWAHFTNSAIFQTTREKLWCMLLSCDYIYPNLTKPQNLFLLISRRLGLPATVLFLLHFVFPGNKNEISKLLYAGFGGTMGFLLLCIIILVYKYKQVSFFYLCMEGKIIKNLPKNSETQMTWCHLDMFWTTISITPNE